MTPMDKSTPKIPADSWKKSKKPAKKQGWVSILYVAIGPIGPIRILRSYI
jgi:hypothetical protein